MVARGSGENLEKRWKIIKRSAGEKLNSGLKIIDLVHVC